MDWWIVQNIRKRIGERVIYGVSGYMKRNGLDGRGVQIYEEEWTGRTAIYGVSGYMKRNGLDGLNGRRQWRG